MKSPFKKYLAEIFRKPNPVEIMARSRRYGQPDYDSDVPKFLINNDKSEIILQGFRDNDDDDYDYKYFYRAPSRVYQYFIRFCLENDGTLIVFYFRLEGWYEINTPDIDDNSDDFEEFEWIKKESIDAENLDDKEVVIKVYNAVLFLTEKIVNENKDVYVFSFSGAREKVRLYERLVSNLAAAYGLVDLFTIFPKLHQIIDEIRENDDYQEENDLSDEEKKVLEDIDISTIMQRNGVDEKIYILVRKEYAGDLANILGAFHKDQLTFDGYVDSKNKSS
jgi:NACalpha-BTF3-like transcription factor